MHRTSPVDSAVTRSGCFVVSSFQAEQLMLMGGSSMLMLHLARTPE
jgi:hypothetical protein